MGAPRVSIVTVNRNHIDGLKRTMESLRAQRERNVEHIIVDGASSDGSASWATSNAAYERTTVISEPDAGIYDAMNKGLALATAPIVTFLNAGDSYARDDVTLRAANQLEESGAIWGFGLAKIVTKAGLSARPIKYRAYSNWAHGVGTMFVSHQCVFMNTGWLRRLGGFDQTFGAAADVHCLLRTGYVHKPATWGTVDVLYEAGGLSDRQVCRQLWIKHKIRTAVWSLGPIRRSLSAAFAGYQIAMVYPRRWTKRLLGRRFQKWWGSRRSGGVVE